MVWIMRFSGLFAVLLAVIVLSPSLQSFPPAEANRSSHLDAYLRFPTSSHRFSLRRAPVFRIAADCAAADVDSGVCNPSLVHVAITLDFEYLRSFDSPAFKRDLYIQQQSRRRRESIY